MKFVKFKLFHYNFDFKRFSLSIILFNNFYSPKIKFRLQFSKITKNCYDFTFTLFNIDIFSIAILWEEK